MYSVQSPGAHIGKKLWWLLTWFATRSITQFPYPTITTVRLRSLWEKMGFERFKVTHKIAPNFLNFKNRTKKLKTAENSRRNFRVREFLEILRIQQKKWKFTEISRRNRWRNFKTNGKNRFYSIFYERKLRVRFFYNVISWKYDTIAFFEIED